MELTTEQIIDYQTILKENGFDPGPIDGIIGPQTRQAARDAMASGNLPLNIRAVISKIRATEGLVFGTDANTEETEDTTMYWGRYDSGSWFTSTLGGKPEGSKWAWELPEFEGTSQEDYTSDNTLEEVLDKVTDPAVNPPGGGGGEGGGGEGDVSTGFQGTQLWELDGKTYVVFSVPDTDIFIRYEADQPTLDLYYSSGREKPDVISKSVDDEEWVNSSFFGSLAEVDEDILLGDKDPFTGLADKFDTAKKYRPWLEDDELYDIWLEAFIENRDILDEEWKTTEWWRTHTQEERDWLLLSQGQDLSTLPADATAYLNNNIIKFRDMFKAAGVTNIEDIVNTNGESFLDWFSFNFTSGKWTELYTLDQLKAIADPSTGIEQDEAITTWMQGKAEGVDVSTTKQFEAQVENLANEWLGPLYGVLTDEQKSDYAAMIRNAESEEIGASNVIEKFKGIRGTLFGDYDENLTYNEIATPWRNYSFQLLGQRMDETDATFVDVIKANDQKTATTMLTEWGINNNATTLLDKVTDDIGQALGAGQVVRGVAT